MDDIVITDSINEEHLENLETLLKKLQEERLRAKLDKCEFFKKQIKYLGHMIDSEGVRPTLENVQAIIHLPPPKDLKQLQSFLGKANYYSKFIRQFATVAAPLNALRKKESSLSGQQHVSRRFRQSNSSW